MLRDRREAAIVSKHEGVLTGSPPYRPGKKSFSMNAAVNSR